MGVGYLTVQTRTAEDALPVGNAHVVISSNDGELLYETYTDANGNSEAFPITAPDKEHTLDPTFAGAAYSTVRVDVTAEGYVSVHVAGVEIVDTQTSILPVRMLPLVDEPSPETDEYIYIPPVALVIPAEDRQVGPPSVASSARVARDVIIPDYITVHLGTPTNAAARNVRVRFTDYIKNVTSSEIYSTWPQNSLIANIHVIVTFAVNRVFTEWYRSRGFNFDITNSTSYDMFYRDGGVIFQNISALVDSYFNVYARRAGFINPFFTQFCNGTTVTCNGLSQWGTVTLANQGKTPIEILRSFYPNDLELVASNNITGIVESYPGTPLRVGSTGEPVRRMQNYLNRIRVNYPLIPQIVSPNGTFGSDTENAVRIFQRTFNMPQDGIIGRDTWNKISFIFVAVTGLAELQSEGIRAGIGTTPPTVVLSQGSTGQYVLELQYILNAISPYYPTVPSVIQDGVFGPNLKNAVIEFQKTFGLTPDGIVGPGTWNKLYAVYNGIRENVLVPPAETPPVTSAPPYPGTPLRVGSTGNNVRIMQSYLNTIRAVYPSIPNLVVDGIFGNGMREAVVAFQRQFALTPDGIIGPATWDKIVEQFLLVTGQSSVNLTFPGTLLKLGSRGSDVRTMQTFLSEIRSFYPSLPAVTVDGIFGPNTQAAVSAFQRVMGLTADGIIGPVTWYAIIEQRNALL